jgi:hypothetical protein
MGGSPPHVAGEALGELHKTTDAQRQIRAHDLRGVFVTLSLSAGKSETWIGDRTGHDTSDMIQKYRRAARTWSELDLGALAPMDQAVVGLPKLHSVSDSVSIAAPDNRAADANANGSSWFQGRDSNWVRSDFVNWRSRTSFQRMPSEFLSLDDVVESTGVDASRHGSTVVVERCWRRGRRTGAARRQLPNAEARGRGFVVGPRRARRSRFPFTNRERRGVSPDLRWRVGWRGATL